MVSRSEAVLAQLDPVALNASLKTLAADIDTMLTDVSAKGGYSLASIEVAVEVTVEAGINLIGTAKAGGKAGLVLKFEKAGPA
jgi:hypothetical protein